MILLFFDSFYIAVLWTPRRINYRVRYDWNLIHIAAYPSEHRETCLLYHISGLGNIGDSTVRHSANAIVRFSGFTHMVSPFKCAQMLAKAFNPRSVEGS